MAGDIEVITADLFARLGRFPAAIGARLAPALDSQADAAVIRLKGGAYWVNRTNKTRESVKVRGGDGDGSLGRRVVVTVKWAEALDKGSKAHEIRARRKGALAFAGPGGLVFRRKVKHPGTKALDFSGKETALVEQSFPPIVEGVRDGAIADTGLGL